MKVVGFFSMAGINNIAAKCNNPEDLNPQDFFFSKISRPYLGHTQPSRLAYFSCRIAG